MGQGCLGTGGRGKNPRGTQHLLEDLQKPNQSISKLISSLDFYFY